MKAYRAMSVAISTIAILIVGYAFVSYYGIEFGKFLNINQPVMRIGTTYIPVIVADTPEKRTQGLSGMSSLPPNEGMLFVFPTSEYHAFWMKDMNFAIDIVWIDENKTIINIQHDVTPETYPEKFRPMRPAQYVLEVPAGFAEKKAFVVGEPVILPDQY